jgi:hypothetical protein
MAVDAALQAAEREGIHSLKDLKDYLEGTKCSLSGETPVATKSGLVAISEIKVGNLVLARNVGTGKENWRKVLRTFENDDPDTVRITVAKDGKSETIVSDGKHPFFVDGKGFVAARFLKAGEKILSSSGNFAKVSTFSYSVTQPLHAYNLEVDQDHTFFVGKLRLWVHNVGDCGKSTVSSEAGKPTGIPDSVHTQISKKSGKALQNTVYDSDGNGIAHVDFRGHHGSPSSHGHLWPAPGKIDHPKTGYIPPDKVPDSWKRLPEGIDPEDPAGTVR